MAGGGLDEELKRRLKLSARHRSEGRSEGRPPQRPLPTPAHSPQLTTARWWTSSSPGQMGARGMLCREGVGERPCSAWPSLTLPCPVQPAPTPSLGPPASLASDPPPGHRHGSIRREGLLGVTHHFLEGPCCTGPNVPQPLSSPEGASPGQTRAAPEARLCRSLQTHQGGPGNLNPSGREREGEVSLSSLPRTSESDPRPWPQEPEAHLIISVHRTASCSSISRSLYWLRSMSTRAISTRVKRRRCAMGILSCGESAAAQP